MSDDLRAVLVEHHIQRQDRVIESRVRASEAMPPEERTALAATMDPAEIRGEIKRRGLAAAAAGLKAQRRTTRAQIADEINAIKVHDPSPLQPIRDADVQAARAKKAAPDEDAT